MFRVTISLACIQSGWGSHPSHLQITISQAECLGREPLWALMTRFWSLWLGRRNASVTWGGGKKRRKSGLSEP